jgi:hypothetical protein
VRENLLFLKKKKQKDFALLDRAHGNPEALHKRAEVLWFFFSKKDDPFLHSTSGNATHQVA